MSNFEELGTVNINATLFYPFLNKKNDLAKKYTVDIVPVAEEDRAALTSLAADGGKTKNTLLRMKDKHPTEGETEFFVAKSNYPIDALYHPNGEQLTPDELGKLGNGTEGQFKIKLFITGSNSSQYGKNIGANIVIGKITNPEYYVPRQDLFDEGVVLKTREKEDAVKPPSSPDKVDFADLDDSFDGPTLDTV